MSKPQKKSAASERDESLPLFFRKPAVIDAARHKDAGLSRKSSLAFCRGANSVPISAHEFVEISRSYPIVFTNEEVPMPLAVVGLKQRNSFVTKDNEWLEGHYIPAYVRKYPFALVDMGKDNTLALCIDEEAEHFQAKKPDFALFLGGKPTSLAQQAIDLCGLFHNQYHQTRQLGELLKQQGLLESKDMFTTLSTGEEVKLGGFLLISEERLNALSDKDFLVWRKKQWLGLLYLAMASQSNWKYLAAQEVKSL